MYKIIQTPFLSCKLFFKIGSYCLKFDIKYFLDFFQISDTVHSENFNPIWLKKTTRFDSIDYMCSGESGARGRLGDLFVGWHNMDDADALRLIEHMYSTTMEPI